MAATPPPSAGLQSLHRLKQTSPPMYLTPSPDLSHLTRTASHHLFSLLKPYTPKSPFDRLLVDPQFDAEQIWQQIDLQSQPLISSLRRHVGMFEKDPKEVKRVFEKMGCDKIDGVVEKRGKNDAFDDLDDLDEDDDDDDDDEVEDDVEEEGDDVEEVEGGVKRDVGGGGGDDGKDGKDLFYDSDEMIKFMDDEDAKEFGGGKAKKAVKKTGGKYGEDDEEEEEDEDDDEEDDEYGILGLAGDESDSEPEEIHYKDFYLSNKKNDQSKKPKANKEVEDMNVNDDEEEENEDLEDGEEDDEEDGEEDDDEDGEEDEDMASDEETKRANLSTHEKQLIEQRAKIEQVEKESLDAKAWTMQGEVNATKRPKNSALEVDLDWERNAKPPPVITEEVSQSIEELIMKRISEGHFDDVERVNRLPSKAPREMKELDENQNKKGLGEIYADEYAQKTGLVSKALSFSDEQKKEAALLFKKLCVKLDSLSHFHFTPKPEIRDMTIETNVPALAMEEIAPLAVSDAAMLAPEEVFAGKGDIKEEAELTQADRKRRRAGFKRKYKAENANKTAKKPREKTLTAGDGKEEL